MLRAAHDFMNGGRYAEAAMAFQQLARTAEERFPERAPMLFLQAGRAAILDGQTEIGVGHIRRGLTIFASQGRYGRMQMLGKRVVDELRSQGLQAQAEEISALLEDNKPQEKETESDTPAQRALLPSHCPFCGAALRPGEVDWVNPVTAVCAYCGSPVRAAS